MVAHVLAHVGPHRKQDTLAFVVAGTVLVGGAEVAGHDRPVDSAHDLTEGDLLRHPGEDVAAAHATLGADEAGTFESEENLLEVGLRKACSLCYVADRSGRGVLAQCEGQKGAARVVTSGRHLHNSHATAAAETCERLLSQQARVVWPNSAIRQRQDALQHNRGRVPESHRRAELA